jgi:hypothetical protein
VRTVGDVLDLYLTAAHVRMVTADGNYEFEHSVNTPITLLDANFLGTQTAH